MPHFKEIPANKISTAKRKLIHGIGINDSDYLISKTFNGKTILCPFYRSWIDMIRRCYDLKFKKRNPTYKDCVVTKEWLTFSNFKSWMKTQIWQGKQLDKDIINPGNKVYSPENCCFVSHEINSLLLDSGASRGEYPRGVHFYKRYKKFMAYCSVNGKKNHLGYFSNPTKAAMVYREFKYKLIQKEALKQTDKRIKDGLLIHALFILNGVDAHV